MTAVLTATPSECRVGEAVALNADGFTGGATVTFTCAEEGFSSEVVADAGGSAGTTDVADHATTTLTLSGNAVAAETVTIGAVVYTWRAAPSTANEVKIGVDAATSLANLKKAINASGLGNGTDYGAGTVAHPTAFAHAITPTTLKVSALTGGTAGNSLASTETMTLGAWSGTTFNSGTPGTAATGIDAVIWNPTHVGTFEMSATDGTNTATCSVRVWS